MTIKFTIVFIIGIAFIVLYCLTLRRERKLEKAEEIEATITELFFLEIEKPKFGFTIDRGEAFGNYIKIEYKYGNKTKEFESPLVNKKHTIGDIIKIRRLDDENIVLCDEISYQGRQGDKLKMAFIGMAALLICISLIGFYIH